jgi:hypothetical protein
MIAELVATALITVAAAVGAVPVEQTVGTSIHDVGSTVLEIEGSGK